MAVCDACNNSEFPCDSAIVQGHSGCLEELNEQRKRGRAVDWDDDLYEAAIVNGRVEMLIYLHAENLPMCDYNGFNQDWWETAYSVANIRGHYACLWVSHRTFGGWHSHIIGRIMQIFHNGHQ